MMTIPDQSYRDEYVQFLMYRLDFGSAVFKHVYYLMKMMFHVCFNHFCTSVILLLYLTACYYASSSLEKFKNDVVSTPFEEFMKIQPALSERYCKIIVVVQDIQQTFSLTSFFLCLGYIAASFTTLSFMLLFPERGIESLLFENVFALVTTAFHMIMLFYFGGRIPVKMVEVRNAFHVKCSTISSGKLHPDVRMELTALSKLVDLPEIVLSGCDILYYTKKNIFSALGSFITYTLLLLQFNNKGLSRE
ncbi:hypothetical protein NPIL_553141 [Nephila pilipes]|uniref:Gustatory receptor n=1 Tax=Nephila pilipes TaxID=299642 RepID=A0A8X6IIK3_NEPPI|nr:hypothetical protein NPIL_553141 [Nephila pilipes]